MEKDFGRFYIQDRESPWIYKEVFSGLSLSNIGDKS